MRGARRGRPGHRLGAEPAVRVEPPPYESRRDPETGILNPVGLEDYSRRLADAVARELRGAGFRSSWAETAGI